jgi:hypothetical protein
VLLIGMLNVLVRSVGLPAPCVLPENPAVDDSLVPRPSDTRGVDHALGTKDQVTSRLAR